MSRNTELCSICPAECNPVRLSPPGTRTLVSSHTPKAFSRAFLRLRFIISAVVSREWAQSWLARLGGSCLPAVLFVRRGQQSLWDCTQLPRNRIPALAEGGRKGHMLGTTEKQISQEGKTSPVGKHTKTSEHRGFVPCNGAALPDSCCLLTLQAFSALSLSLQTKSSGTKLFGLLLLDQGVRSGKSWNRPAAVSRSQNSQNRRQAASEARRAAPSTEPTAKTWPPEPASLPANALC